MEKPISFSARRGKPRGLPFVGAPPGAADAEPLGYRLRDLGYLHMNITYEGGTAWACFRACGVHSFGRGESVTAFSIAPSSDPAYYLEYSVGSLTASPPAVAGVAVGQ